MIKLTNEKKKMSIDLDYSGYFLISSVDWGTVDAQSISTKAYKQLGETFRYSIGGSRLVKIDGYILGNEKTILNRRKHLLSKIANVFDELTISVNGYDIKGVPSCSPYFGVEESENNEYFCLFRLEINCYNPMFIKKDNQIVNLSQWQKNLEFDFYFEQPMEIEYKIASSYVNIYNNGDIDSYIYMQIKTMAEVVNPTITNIKTGEYIKFNLTVQPNYILLIDTENKKFTLQDEYGETSLYMYRDKYSSLGMKLNVGDNLIQVSSDSGADNMDVMLDKKEKFWGCDWIA